MSTLDEIGGRVGLGATINTGGIRVGMCGQGRGHRLRVVRQVLERKRLVGSMVSGPGHVRRGFR